MNDKPTFLTRMLVPFIGCLLLFSLIGRENNGQEARAELSAGDQEDLMSIKYTDADLTDFINRMAAQRNINMILPMGGNAIKEKLTLNLDHKITAQEAWTYLLAILNMADYRVIEQDSDVTIARQTKESAKEPTKHLYIDAELSCLPDNEELIRYIYTLSHLRVPAEGKSELSEVLSAILPDVPFYKIDSASNSILLIAPSRSVVRAVELLKAIDIAGFQEKMERVTLKYSSASMVANIFNEHILKQQTDDYGYRPEPKKKGEKSYFSRNVRVVADDRTNSLIVLGRSQAVNRVKEFIEIYIDVELDSGKSIIHTYELQYLDVTDFAEVLDKIVKSSRQGGTEQSRAGETSGPDQIFNDVIIKTDRPLGEKTKYHGGNKLIVVARNRDWEFIKNLIQELDKAQPQVLIEVLIADLTIDDTRLLGTMLRNPAKIPMPNGMNFQSAQVNPGVIADNVSGQAQTIGILDGPKIKAAADLLGNTVASQQNNQTIPNSSRAGATLMSINDSDGTTWGILKVLKLFEHTKILDHPHVIATHNKPARIETGESRLLADEILLSENNNNFRRNKHIVANTVVEITPRITSMHEHGLTERVVNLTVTVDINQFKSSSVNTRIMRTVTTNTNVNDNAILALGGLVRTSADRGEQETPVLGKIPIIGWFFKQRDTTAKKTCLTIFIRPTIIEPYRRAKLDQATQDYIDVARHYAHDSSLFDSLKDPITHLFFKPGPSEKDIDAFIRKDPRKSRPTDDYEPSEHAAHDEKWNLVKQQLKDEDNPFQRG